MEKKIITELSLSDIQASSEDENTRYKIDNLINTLNEIKDEGFDVARFKFDCRCWGSDSSDAEAEVIIEGISEREETDEECSERLKKEQEKIASERKAIKEAEEAKERAIYLQLKAKYGE